MLVRCRGVIGESMSIANGYDRANSLAEPEWLWEHRDDPNVRVVDCSDPAGYARAHIPGSVRLRGDEMSSTVPADWLKDRDDPLHVMKPEAFADLMARCGVSVATTVVAYDDYNGTAATRLWWVLTFYGHADVKVLNGGWQRWVDEGRPVAIRETTPERGSFTPRPREALRVRLDELMLRYSDPDVRIVNVLWPGMYAGTVNPFENKRVGHIPGSINLPIERFFADEHIPRLKPANELRTVLAEAGLSGDTDTVVHCHAGVRTTMAIFVMWLLGWDRVRAYEASMAEWANRDETPLTTG